MATKRNPELLRIAHVGPQAPSPHGTVLFPAALRWALAQARPRLCQSTVALVDGGGRARFEGRSGAGALSFGSGEAAAGAACAAFLRSAPLDGVWLHLDAAGGGAASATGIGALLEALRTPGGGWRPRVLTSLAWVPANPPPEERRRLAAVVDGSAGVIVHTLEERGLLLCAYGAREDQVVVVPWGVPDRWAGAPQTFKRALGLAAEKVLLVIASGPSAPERTDDELAALFGALPELHRRVPGLLTVVWGGGPPVPGAAGPATTESAAAAGRGSGDHDRRWKTRALDEIARQGLSDAVCLVDRALTEEEVGFAFGAADVCAVLDDRPGFRTASLFGLAVGSGRPCVLPTGDAAEGWRLGEDLVALAPPRAASWAGAISELLLDDRRRQAVARATQRELQPLRWPRLAERYLAAALADPAISDGRGRRSPPGTTLAPPAGRHPTPGWHRSTWSTGRGPRPPLPEVVQAARLLRSLTDDTGLLSGTRLGVPDRRRGYSLLDNARALSLVALGGPWADDRAALVELAPRLAAFVEHAFHEERRCFLGALPWGLAFSPVPASPSVVGHTLLALGQCATSGPVGLRDWALSLLDRACAGEGLAEESNPCALIGVALGTLRDHVVPDVRWLAERMLLRVRGELAAALDRDLDLTMADVRFPWLAHAMITAGVVRGDARCVEEGLTALAPLLLPRVGEDTRQRRDAPSSDLHILVAHLAEARVRALACAWRATHDPSWIAAARRELGGFFGANDKAVVVTPGSIACEDGGRRAARTSLSLLLAATELEMAEAASALSPTASEPTREAETPSEAGPRSNERAASSACAA